MPVETLRYAKCTFLTFRDKDNETLKQPVVGLFFENVFCAHTVRRCFPTRGAGDTSYYFKLKIW